MSIFLYFKLRKASNTEAVERKRNILLNDYEMYNNFLKSEELKHYKALEAEVLSDAFKQNRKTIEKKRYKNSSIFNEEKELKRLQKSKKLNESDLVRLESLKERVNSEDFKTEKKYLQDKKRYEKSKDFKKMQEFKALTKSEAFVKFFKLQKKNKFEALKQWELTFSDEFDGSSLDTEKWLTNYYWGDKLLGANYSHSDDRHAFSAKNIKINSSAVNLKVKKESQNGLAWDIKMGFIPKKFDYTSGIISTGKSFRQKFGKFEAKIKANNAQELQHAFWLLSEKNTPHIDILKTQKNRLLGGNYWGADKSVNNQSFKVKGIDLSKGYFIYTLEWSADKLVWKINDVVVKTVSQGIPQEAMFLNFAVLVKQANSNGAEMGIDWVRCYQKK